MGDEPTLLHAPPSLYSQIARLVLAEKRVEYRAKLRLPGPPSFDTYTPEYLRLNPQGTVPTLIHGETVIPDSREILPYVDEHFAGPALQPSDADERRRMEHFIERLYRVSFRTLSYAQLVVVGARANAARVRALRRRIERDPASASLYADKLRDIERFQAEAADEAYVAATRADLDDALDELDAGLSERPFVAGASYSLADLVWTAAVARCMMLKFDPLARRPALARWYARMRDRPSFAAADVWERVKPHRLLATLARRLVMGSREAG
jgi:ganglioside-induced differentiation-associated protein 1